MQRIAWIGSAALLLLVAACPKHESGGCSKDVDCATGEVCLGAQCLPGACGDRPCVQGQACVQGACVGSGCASVTCPAGQTCANGQCYPRDCADQTCQAGEICWQDGSCRTSLCQGVTCSADETCADGKCLVTACAGIVCAQGAACMDGQCQDVRCIGVVCPATTVCADGRCVPQACQGVSCLSGYGCVDGQCMDVRCVGVTCAAGLQCSAGACAACKPGTCGVAGSQCTQTCLPDGGFGPCQPPSGPIDTQTDVGNCGQCGLACPVPLHAQAVCSAGKCGRGPCAPGYFDLDPGVFGCATSCQGQTCTLPDGGSVHLDAPALPESGAVWQAFGSGGSYGSAVQTSAAHTHFGVIGEPTPGGVGGVTVQQGAAHRNISGFNAALHQ